jgi:hypothetical protein
MPLNNITHLDLFVSIMFYFTVFQKLGHLYFITNNQKCIYSQTCIKRSPLGLRKKLPFKTGDLLKEV